MISKNFSLRLLKSSLLVFLVLCSSCKDKHDFGKLSINVGKYKVTQFRNYPNGIKDTLYYISYGPVYDGMRYSFSLNDTSSVTADWVFYPSSGHNYDTISTITLEYFSPFDGSDETHYYKVLSYENEDDKLIVNYTYRNVFNMVSDSATGVIIFDRIP